MSEEKKMGEFLDETIKSIRPLDQTAMQAARERQNQLTKPQGALGRLEELSIQIAGITGNPRPKIEKKAIVVMAADHGVVASGVSLYPQEVTKQMVGGFLTGTAAINVLARHIDAKVVAVDMGVNGGFQDYSKLICEMIDFGTQDSSGENPDQKETGYHRNRRYGHRQYHRIISDLCCNHRQAGRAGHRARHRTWR